MFCDVMELPSKQTFKSKLFTPAASKCYLFSSKQQLPYFDKDSALLTERGSSRQYTCRVVSSIVLCFIKL